MHSRVSLDSGISCFSLVVSTAASASGIIIPLYSWLTTKSEAMRAISTLVFHRVRERCCHMCFFQSPLAKSMRLIEPEQVRYTDSKSLYMCQLCTIILSPAKKIVTFYDQHDSKKSSTVHLASIRRRVKDNYLQTKINLRASWCKKIKSSFPANFN
jgi:hypothetical protein